MKNKLDLNSRKTKKDIFEFLAKIQEKFFHDVNFEMDFAQGGMFIESKDKENNVKKSRMSRIEILLGLCDGELSISDFLLSLGLNKEILDNLGEEKSLHIFLYKLLEEFLEIEGFDDFLTKLLSHEKNKIFGYISETEDINEKNFFERIIGVQHPLNTTGLNVNKAVDGVLKPKKD